MPVPVRVPPALTVTPLDDSIEPSTASAPPLTTVAPV